VVILPLDWLSNIGRASQDTGFADRNAAPIICTVVGVDQIIVAFDTIIQRACGKVKKIIAHATTFPPK
jgi:hypothetical protein